MRISDWSSDVCSSDLLASEIVERALDMRREQMLGRRGIAVEPRFDELTMLEIGAILAARGLEMRDHIAFRHPLESLDQLRGEPTHAPPHQRGLKQIGSASWRETGCQYV